MPTTKTKETLTVYLTKAFDSINKKGSYLQDQERIDLVDAINDIGLNELADNMKLRLK